MVGNDGNSVFPRFQVRIGSVLLVLLWSSQQVKATSIKMDFLPLGDVRTDPIINPTCLSDHIHTFYGANKMRPETTYEDLRNSDGNSGNVEENKSLYWHPTVYEVTSNGVYRKAEIWFTSAYYIWTTGQATAFPDGFKMVAGFGGVPEARANFECVGCEAGGDDCHYTSFPEESCVELEVSMAFPTCWDGVNIDSEDHMSHVSYDNDGGYFDGECPDSHPVKLPEIQFFFRILPYPGGTHVFADGTNFYHADYFSGWDSAELQFVLDNCENESEAANPDAWCEDFLTFRDAPKVANDENTIEKLSDLQPCSFDTSTITDEVTDDTTDLPRGSCTGTLQPEPLDPPPCIESDDSNESDDPDELVDTDLGTLCLSADVTVRLENEQEHVPIKDLNHQEKNIATVNNNGELVYQEMYAFGHWNLYSVGRFLRMDTNASKNEGGAPLEISREHLLFKYDDASGALGISTQAGLIETGDFIMGEDGRRELVTAISNIEKQGIFSPLVMDGTFLASGIKVSSYTTTAAERVNCINTSKISYPHWMKIGDNLHIPLSYHMLTHTVISPFRVLCRYSEGFCQKRNAEGQLLFVATGENLLSFLLIKQEMVIQAMVIFFVFFSTLPLYFLEQIWLLSGTSSADMLPVTAIGLVILFLHILFPYIRKAKKKL